MTWFVESRNVNYIHWVQLAWDNNLHMKKTLTRTNLSFEGLVSRRIEKWPFLFVWVHSHRCGFCQVRVDCWLPMVFAVLMVIHFCFSKLAILLGLTIVVVVVVICWVLLRTKYQRLDRLNGFDWYTEWIFKSNLSLTMIRRVAIIVRVVAEERRIKEENTWGRDYGISHYEYLWL